MFFLIYIYYYSFFLFFFPPSMSLRMVEGRHYVQPQWVVDSANERVVLPTGSYAPGTELPPHLSPFVDDNAIGYTPDQRKRLDALKERIAQGMLVDDKDSLEAIIPEAMINGTVGSDNEDEDVDSDDDSDDDRYMFPNFLFFFSSSFPYTHILYIFFKPQ